MNQFNASVPETSRRARLAVIALVTLFGILVIAFFRLQVLESNTYGLRSDSNRLRPFPIEAPRGAVFDRNGRVIASSVPGYSLHVFPSTSPGVMETTLERLQFYLGLDDERAAAPARTSPKRSLSATPGGRRCGLPMSSPRWKSTVPSCPTSWSGWTRNASTRAREPCPTSWDTWVRSPPRNWSRSSTWSIPAA